jgi:hypothetical protein
MQQVEPRTLSEAERSAILDREMQMYLANGFRVVSRTPATAQLLKAKSFNAGYAILGALFLLIGLVIYVLIYLGQKDVTVSLSVDEQGAISRQESGRAVQVVQPGQAFPMHVGDRVICAACGYANMHTRTLCKKCKAPL